MLTSIRGLIAASLFVGCGLAATPAFADETDVPSDFTVTGNVQGVTDYRFRGISLSGGDFAIQGSIGVSHSSGFYVGTWASSLEDTDVFGSTELDLYAGWTGAVTSGLTADVGMLYYVYPNGHSGDANLFEPYASLTAAVGPATAKVGVNYAWHQDSLEGDDNLYLYGELGAAIPNSPVSIGAHLGWTDGYLSPKRLTGQSNGSGFDYSLTGTVAMTKNLSASLSYVGVDGRAIDNLSNDTAVASLKLTF